jgi:hypothetical protein
MTYDPTIYLGSAAYYARGRPPYSRDLASTLADVSGLDSASRLLDVGCGPGVSMSFAAPHLFGPQLDAFTADLRGELAARSPGGLFWDWPGDTQILLARKPA